MKAGAVVRRYAAALYRIGVETKSVEDLGRELDFLAELFADRKLKAFLRNPRIASAEKRKIFVEKISPHVSANVRNFVNLAFDRGREDVMEGVARAYRSIWMKSAGMAEGVVETVMPISDAEKAELEASLSKRFGVVVRLESKITPSLIGGLRVTVGHRRMERSVQSTLAGIAARWSSAPLG